jgi:hypothetical protein
MQGDRVNTEYYLQFADHYFRVLAETRSRFEENRRQNGGAPYEEDEQEYDEDGEPIARPERQAETRQPDQRQPNSNSSGGGYNGQNRNEGQDRQNGNQNGNQYTGQYDDERPRSRNNGYGDGGNDRAPREDRGDRGNSYRGEDRGNRASYGQEEEDRAPVRQESAPVPQAAAPVEEPRRRGRPPRRPVEGQVRDEAPAAFEADRLPPSLNISAVVADDVEVEEKPKRRRGRPPASETTTS